MERQFYVSSSPHLQDKETVPRIMFSVVLALIPAAVGAVYFFREKALWVIIISIATAVVTEAGIEKVSGKTITIADGSAIVTGILLAFNLPPDVPFWLPIVGSFFAIAVGKQVFGGLGYNPMNPALLGRAFLLASWPVRMTVFREATATPKGGTLSGIDIVTSATPLRLMKESMDILAHEKEYGIEKVNQAYQAVSQLTSSPSYVNLFWGKVGGCLGETSVFLLLIGAAYLMYKGYIGWSTPLSYVATVAILSWIFAGPNGFFSGDPIFHIFSGGLILGAFFMATDMVTTPIARKGRLYFGIGCGVLTTLIRLIGGYPEGVSYSILFMNLIAPLLDRYTRSKKFGEARSHA